MAIFNTPRARRNQDGYMETLISNMYTDENVIYKNGYGVCGFGPEDIVNCFNAVRRNFCKINSVRVHFIEVVVEKEHDEEEIIKVADMVACQIWNLGYQVFYCVAELDDCYLIAVAINSTSFVTGFAFKDNNMHYVYIYNMIKAQMPADWELEVAENVVFNPNDGTGNFTHGYFA